MKTFTTFNGNLSEQPYTTYSVLPIRQRTATTQIGNLNRTKRVMRNVEAKEKIENEFMSIAASANRNNRAERKGKMLRARQK